MNAKISRILSAGALAIVVALAIAACDTPPTPTPAPPLPTPPQQAPPPQPNAPTPAPTVLLPTPVTQVTSTRAQGNTTPTIAPVQAVATPTAEQAVAPEQNPVGDIPDTQVFVKYVSSAGGYEIQAPEGWARIENGPNVSFADKLDGISVTITDTASAPTAATVRNDQAAALQKTGRAVQITDVKDVTLPSGPAVFVDYTSNSEPSAVTGKQVRLENNAYLFYRNGKLAILTMWAPLGADNVDQWKLMSESFKWR